MPGSLNAFALATRQRHSPNSNSVCSLVGKKMPATSCKDATGKSGRIRMVDTIGAASSQARDAEISAAISDESASWRRVFGQRKPDVDAESLTAKRIERCMEGA